MGAKSLEEIEIANLIAFWLRLFAEYLQRIISYAYEIF